MIKEITSVNNYYIKNLLALKNKQGRNNTNLFIVLQINYIHLIKVITKSIINNSKRCLLVTKRSSPTSIILSPRSKIPFR